MKIIMIKQINVKIRISEWVNGYRNVQRMSDGEHVNGYGRYGMGSGMW